MAFVYRVINPVVKTILKSRFHGVLSNNTLMISFVGRKSGNTYEIPISYARDGAQFLCFTARGNQWWRNLRDGVVINLLVAGDHLDATSYLEMTERDTIVRDLMLFLTQVPRDAKPSGVRLDKAGKPHADDLAAAAESLVSIRFTAVAGANHANHANHADHADHADIKE
ncbi:MAG: hypothetical protein RIC89_13795 [Pseudomonadales bacterium]